MITKNEAHLIISNELATRRQNAEFIKNENLDNAFKKSEHFKKLYNLVRSLQFEYAKQTNPAKAQEILTQFNTARENLRAELKKLNLTKEDMEPKFVCNICKDTGFVNNTECACYKKLKNEVYLKASGTNQNKLPSFNNVDFSIFDADKQNEVKNIYKISKDFILKFKETDKQNLVILGNTGVGKTYLTDCILNEAIHNNIFSLWTTAFALNNEFYNMKFASIKEREEILEPYLTCELLIIDDLGSEPKYDNTTIEGLYNILNERLRSGLKTIITSNYTPEQLQELYLDRVFSRIFNKQVGIILNMPTCYLRLKSKK